MNPAELNALAKQYYNQGHWQQAAQYFEQALLVSRTQADLLTQASALDSLATLHCYQLGQRAQALDFYQQAMSLWQEAGDKAGEALTGVNIAGMYQADGRFEEARQLMEHVIELDQALDSPHLRSHRIILGAIRKRLRRLAEAEENSTQL